MCRLVWCANRLLLRGTFQGGLLYRVWAGSGMRCVGGLVVNAVASNGMACLHFAGSAANY